MLREALANILTGASRPVTWAAVLAVLLSLLGLWDSASVAEIRARANQFTSSGASIWSFESKDRIDGDVCDALKGDGHTRAAGALRHSLLLRSLKAPRSTITTFVATEGFRDLIPGAGDKTAHVYFSRALASEFGLRVGDVLDTTGGSIRVDGVFDWPDDGRNAQLHRAIVVLQNDGSPFDSCWTDIWPSDERSSTLGYIPAADPADVSRSQINASLGASLDPSSLLEARWSRFAPILAGVLSLVIGVAAVMTRKAEIASALRLGVSRSNAITICCAEIVIWSVPAVSMAVAISAALVVAPGGTATAMLPSFGVAFSGLLGVVWGGLLAVLSVQPGRLMAYVGERR